MEYYFRFYFDQHKKAVGFWIVPPVSPSEKSFYEKARAVEYYLNDGTYITYGKYPDNYLNTDGNYMVLLSMNQYETDLYNVVYFGASANVYLYHKHDKSLSRTLNVKVNFCQPIYHPFIQVMIRIIQL